MEEPDNSLAVPQYNKLQFKKVGKLNYYLNIFHRIGVFINGELHYQTALQSEMLERDTLIQGSHPWQDWLLKAIQPCMYRDLQK
jgi:hypothetical protein